MCVLVLRRVVCLSRITTGPHSLFPVEWFPRAHRCTVVFNPVGSVWSPSVQTLLREGEWPELRDGCVGGSSAPGALWPLWSE